MTAAKSSRADDNIRSAFAAGYRATPEGHILNPRGERMKLTPHWKNKYLSFSAGKGRPTLSVHRFVAYQTFGDVALQAECVRHKNDERHDNRPENILYGTRVDNMADIPKEKQSLMGVRRNRKKRRFSDEQVRDIRVRLARHETLLSIQRIYGGSFGAIANIRDGITYLDVT